MQQTWDKARHHQSKASLDQWYVERLNKTLVDECYSVAFRKKRYERSEELQLDLDNVMDSYNYRRMHQGYNLKRMAIEYQQKHIFRRS